MTAIPFLDLGRLHRSIRPDLQAAFDRVLEASSFIGGTEVAAFEDEFGEAHNALAVGCGSGTDALSLSLRALGVGSGDEVVVPSMTFIATAEAVLHVGAVPVIADVDPVTLLLTPETVAPVLTRRTRAVIPVHLYGHVVDVEAMRSWRAAGLIVLEDAAQAHLATSGGEMVGTVGHATCFSFYPGKNLGALGDAGAVISHDATVVDEIKRLRDHGRTDKYVHEELGWSSRLDGIQAAALRAKLPHLEAWTATRRELADRYRNRLAGLLVPWEAGAVHHLLVIRHPGRDDLAARLRGEGIGSGVHYPVPLSRQPSMAAWSSACPEADVAADEVLSLPLDPLMSSDEVDRVCAAIGRAVGS